jgi:hypothetical protein
MRQDPAVDWDRLRATMERLEAEAEEECAALLQLVLPLDRLTVRLVARETSPASDRPQDYVACVLATRSFRLAIASLHLAMSGYPDVGPNLYRTLWEIVVRLAHIESHPVHGALGYLLQGADEQVSAARADADDGGPEGDAHVARCEERYAGHVESARALGLDAEEIRRRHGKLNFRDVCKEHGIERSYLVNFVWSSGYVHEKNLATAEFVWSSGDERFFELGPIRSARAEAMADALGMLIQALGLSASIVGDESVCLEASAMIGRLEKRYRLSAKKRG